MKKSLIASLIATSTLLTACGGDKHDKVYAEEMVKVAEQNAKAAAPQAETVKFDDEGAPKAGETTATDTTTTATADTAAASTTESTATDSATASTEATATADAPATTTDAPATENDTKTDETKSEEKKDGQ